MKKRHNEKPDPSAKRLDDVDKQIINFWTDQSGYLQASRNALAVAARLNYTDEPLTIEQLSNELGIARSTMTNAVREAMAKGFVKSVRMIGKRKEYFVTTMSDPIDTVKEVTRRMLATFILPAIDLYDRLLSEDKLTSPKKQRLLAISHALHYQCVLLQGFFDASSETIRREGGNHKGKKKRSR